MISALFIESGGVYFGLPDVDAWPIQRNAKDYHGPNPVIAHPPCQRWGRMATGGPAAPNSQRIGDDDGCFFAALSKVRRYGGVLEHPADSKAWPYFGLRKPIRHAGWMDADEYGSTCYVEQGHYGHMSRKPSWLYVVRCDLPELIWIPAEQRLHPIALERYGYEKARRIGMAAMVGGKDKTIIRERTPLEFRDVLLSIARSYKCEGDWE